MKSRLFTRWIVLAAVAFCWRVALAEDDSEATGAAADSAADIAADSAALYDLVYKFKAGETLRWEVIHKATVRTSIQGTTETAKTRSESVKAWKVTDVTPEGIITFIHSVESVKMTNELPNRAKVEYDSERDAVPPVGFEMAAKAVGVPLTMIRIDSRGKLIKREARQSQAGGDGTPMVIRLPEQPVAIGATWTQPLEVEVRLKNGQPRRIKSRQRFELESVASGIATIAVDYQVLDPKARRDPVISVQLIQRLSSGKVQLDIEAGRIVHQELSVDQRALGFSGPSSSMHYQMSFTERILKADEKVARKRPRPAGPERNTSVPAVGSGKTER